MIPKLLQVESERLRLRDYRIGDHLVLLQNVRSPLGSEPPSHVLLVPEPKSFIGIRGARQRCIPALIASQWKIDLQS